MPSKSRLQGEAILRIYCSRTGNLVGHLYHWNNGDLQPMWLDEPLVDVRYGPLQQHVA